jgi:hypothetical protein
MDFKTHAPARREGATQQSNIHKGGSTVPGALRFGEKEEF